MSDVKRTGQSVSLTAASYESKAAAPKSKKTVGVGATPSSLKAGKPDEAPKGKPTCCLSDCCSKLCQWIANIPQNIYNFFASIPSFIISLFCCCKQDPK